MNAKKHAQRRRWRNRSVRTVVVAVDEITGWPTETRMWCFGFYPPPGPSQRHDWPRKLRWRAIETCPF